MYSNRSVCSRTVKVLLVEFHSQIYGGGEFILNYFGRGRREQMSATAQMHAFVSLRLTTHAKVRF